jgi:homospermidine synthase
MHYFLNVSQTIWKIEGPITNGQSRDTGNIGRHRKKTPNKQKTKTKTNNNNNHVHKSHKTYHHTKLTGCIIKTDEFDFSVTIS